MGFKPRGMIHPVITPLRSMGIRVKKWPDIAAEVRQSSHGIWKEETD
jgi:hypothetical protein